MPIERTDRQFFPRTQWIRPLDFKNKKPLLSADMHRDGSPRPQCLAINL